MCAPIARVAHLQPDSAKSVATSSTGQRILIRGATQGPGVMEGYIPCAGGSTEVEQGHEDPSSTV